MSCVIQTRWMLVDYSKWEPTSAIELERLSVEAEHIEFRQQRGLSLPGEARRYAICCERIQEIGCQVQRDVLVLPAKPYLGLLAAFRKWMIEDRFVKELEKPTPEIQVAIHRFSCLYFSPDKIKGYFELLKLIANHPEDRLSSLFSLAARMVSTQGLKISEDECMAVFQKRLAFVKRAVDEQSGIVDDI